MNRLANSTSPYLLQHANNPVDWYPWGNEALQKARDEDKLLLVSIGYSACHWCHVMEHESFEDEGIAALMNEYFVCVKVDREERPDIDQIYMSAVQLMTGRGGWPLNCICLPDQRPIYGGTYFPKNDWASLLLNLADFYKTKPAEAADYADKLTAGIRQYETLVPIQDAPSYSIADLQKVVVNWSRQFDAVEGGSGNAPKFPMPNNWKFLMRYAFLNHDKPTAKTVKLTLKKMAYGGIYDHVGGGFARYSVDRRWHIPHFEKMLYDNAQLIGLYAEAYNWHPDELYKNVVDETISFIQRELTSPEGGFYSALDADSEGVEGKFYIWAKTELDNLLGKDAGLFCQYYNITDNGNWEEETTNVLFRNNEDDILAGVFGVTTLELQASITKSKTILLKEREKRVRPGLDNKILASWNGLMLKGLCKAYQIFHNDHYLQLAVENADFIVKNLLTNNGKLTRVFNPRSIEDGGGEVAFLDDYANVIEAFIALYEVTFNIEWLKRAHDLTDIAISDFYDSSSGMFFYTSNSQEALIARKHEIMDGVIPASNSVLARCLKKLGLFFEAERYTEIFAKQLRNVFPLILKYSSAYSNWALLLQEEIFGTYEMAFTGPAALTISKEAAKSYIPNKIVMGGIIENLPLLKNRISAETRIFICKDKTCGLPASTIMDALKQIGR